MILRASIAIDFDGVIADSGLAKKHWLKSCLGLDVSLDSFDRTSLKGIIGSAAYSKMQRSLGFNDTLDVMPVEGAEEAIRTLARAYSVSIVTARIPEKVRWVREWLDVFELSPFIDRVLHSAYVPKLELVSAHNCVALIDNDIRHLIGAGDPCLRRMLFGRSNVCLSTSRASFVEVMPCWRDVIAELVMASGQGSAVGDDR